MEDKYFEQLVAEILHPAEEFSPIPFWFLNDKLEIPELTRQLTDFKAKGVDAVVLHPRIGIPKELEYLSETYFDIIRQIVEAAEKLEMKVVLYDEGMYPSGSAHGQVVAENPSLASMGITKRWEAGDGKIIARLEDGNLLVQDFTGGTIRGIHFGEDDGEQGAPKSADILNPKAVDCFIRMTHNRYYHHLKRHFGKTILGFFTDEPCVMGRNITAFHPWTPGLEDELTAKGAKLSDLNALFEGAENESVRIYHETVRSRLNEVYYKRLSDWCEDRGIWLMGHPEASDDIDQQTYFHVPGQDLIMRRISPEDGGLSGEDSVQAKCSADAARHTRKRRNSNECFGVCARFGNRFHFTGGDMKWMTDWLAVRGVNLFIPHAFYYSIRGARLEERPPDVGPNNIWWSHYRMYSDYIKRVSYIMTDAKNCADVAVICESGKIPSNELAGFYENQVEFNYLPKALLKDSSTELNAGGYSYSCYLADKDMKLNARRIFSVDQVTERDFVPDCMCRDLRVSHIVKNGVHMYFFTNEGEQDLDISGSVAAKGIPVWMDLWRGDIWEDKHQVQDGRTEIHFCLGRRESLLLILKPMSCKTAYGKKKSVQLLELDFKAAGEDKQSITKEYQVEYVSSMPTGNEVIKAYGQEMAELYCNGSFVGASLWSPHRFDVGGYLNPGRNDIRLVFSGSIANRYTDQEIPYGMDDLNREEIL